MPSSGCRHAKLLMCAGSAGEEDQPQVATHASFSVKLKREDNGREIVIPKAVTGEWINQLTLAALNVGRDDFVMLPGPATVVKLKEACGSFSAAAVLKEALQAERGSEASSPEGWVLLGQH